MKKSRQIILCLSLVVFSNILYAQSRKSMDERVKTHVDIVDKDVTFTANQRVAVEALARQFCIARDSANALSSLEEKQVVIKAAHASYLASIDSLLTKTQQQQLRKKQDERKAAALKKQQSKQNK